LNSQTFFLALSVSDSHPCGPLIESRLLYLVRISAGTLAVVSEVFLGFLRYLLADAGIPRNRPSPFYFTTLDRAVIPSNTKLLAQFVFCRCITYVATLSPSLQLRAYLKTQEFRQRSGTHAYLRCSTAAFWGEDP